MAETLRSYVLEDYHAADFIKAKWLPGKRVRLTSPDWRGWFNPGLLVSKGQKAAEVGLMRQDQVAAYEQDALTAIGRHYTNLCFDDQTYQKKEAKLFVTNLRGAVGTNRADEALLTGFFGSALRRKERQFIVDSLEDKTVARKAIIPDKKKLLTKGEKRFFNNVAPVDSRVFWRALTGSINAEAKRRGIGTEAEQMKHLLLVNLERMVGPLIMCGSASLVILPHWWMFSWVVSQQQAYPDQITASAGMVKIADSLLFLKASAWTAFVNSSTVVREQRDQLKYPLGAILGNLGHFFTTGKAPGTPKIKA